MSIFKKMKEKLDKASEEYRGREVNLLNELCERLRQIGVNGTVHVSESWKEPMGRMRISPVLGYVKVEGRNIDLVQMEVRRHMDAEGDVQYLEYLYHYVVQAKVKGLESKLKAEVKSIKKGFLSREVVDFKWEGRELAQLLNADSTLRNMLLREGLNQLPKIEIRPHEKHQCIRITKQPKTREYTKAGSGSIQTLGRKEFPTREAFEIYDRIAQHIRSIATVRP